MKHENTIPIIVSSVTILSALKRGGLSFVVKKLMTLKPLKYVDI